MVESKKDELRARVKSLKTKGIIPNLKVFLVGEHPASVIYTRNKKRFIEGLGGTCEIIKLDQSISVDNFQTELNKVVASQNIHGCFVQLPLPKQLENFNIDEVIPAHIDVDGFSPTNLSKLYSGKNENEMLAPCTPKGVMNMLSYYNIDIIGKSAVVIGRSKIVGKPMTLMLTSHNATVTLAHSKTQNLEEICKKSDIIVSAVGKPRFLNQEYIGSNSPVVIDVGINHDSEGKLCGDVDFEAIKDQCSAITPVPGGVGPLTILMLAENLVHSAEESLK